jgi:AbrB family looped-hinge helix DNA binding protein
MQPKIYGTTTMNDKGQVVIPADARSELGMKPGSRLMIMAAPFTKGVVIVKTEVVEERLRSMTEALSKPDNNEKDNKRAK